ncbi:pancreatic triacylglycerol lipase-like [Brachionus plicatilis]|uniref:Pancreatic triacylglycerol lipase-like n=1 Tax=Brachionus plicatilis TaxID=10195 RepID=A0A3M7TBQ8_BRAPC|nr:pancreatic triacylglycerol lipase-like [Brachionus plicatilis]
MKATKYFLDLWINFICAQFFVITLFQSILVFSEVCYDDLGCFGVSDLVGKSLERYLLPLPNHPDKINTKFYLYNRKSNRSDIISFDSFIIHGFLQNSSRPWSTNMKNEMLKKENVNVIIVDWSKGSLFPYEQAVSNANVVGAEIARLINSLIKQNRTSPDQFHLIGMSLGAHIAGYTGKRVSGLGRISGLDPAGPYFENAEDKIRLAKSDANFVDIIHTDMPSYLDFGFGISKSIGHVDFYVNGGFDQPKCAKKSEQLASMLFILAMKNYQKAKHLITCSHLSIHVNIRHLDVAPRLISTMANVLIVQRMAVIKWDIGLLLSSNGSDNEIQAYGRFSIIFESSNRNSTPEVFDDSKVVFKPSSIETRLISTSEIGEIKNLTTSLISWIYEDNWEFEFIEMMDSEGLKKKFCQVFVETKSQETISKFIKC